MTQALTADTPARDLLKIAIAGLISGVITPLAPLLLDKLIGPSGMVRTALMAVPFSVVVFAVVRRCSANPVWAAIVAGIVTMLAFVCAVSAAAFIHGQTSGASEVMRDILAGLTGGL